jgi:antitoxin CptB
MTTHSSHRLDVRRRKLRFRAWHRGMREVDLIMGGFADFCLAELGEADLDEFERLLEVPDPELLAWVTGEAPPPADYDTPLLRRLCEFNHRGAEAR